jgi:molybdenum cofactor cytidylyltransferase
METHTIARVKFPVIILAAGLSARMGHSKAFLKWDKHATFLEKIIKEYSDFASGQVIVILNQDGYQQLLTENLAVEDYCKIIINPHPERGRLSSIKLGVSELNKKTACYVQNVDNPFVSADLLDAMNNLVENDAYVVPVFEGKGGHPVLMGASVIDSVAEIQEDDVALHLILQKFKRIELETKDDQILVNINTEEDYKNYFHH